MIKSQCIPHVGAVVDGYGVKKHKRKNVRAHRLAFCQSNGIPIESIDGLLVMHSCDNRLCINPSHLSLGSHADNMADKVSKGRQARGEKSGNSKLKDSEVLEIKKAFLYGASAAFLARKFNVSTMCISRIRSGKTWFHLNLDQDS